MPDRSPHFCAEPSCGALTLARRCLAHAAGQERARPNVDVRRWYRTPAWSTLRRAVLLDAAYQCAVCRQITPRLEVDHIVKHHGDRARFWDRANLQALCRKCHQTKTQRGE